jgi:hypothetical protein
MLLSVVWTYAGGGAGTTRRTLCKKYNKRMWDHRMYATFWSILWVIHRRTRHPLDQCGKTTERTLGLPDVRYSVRELVVNFLYK